MAFRFSLQAVLRLRQSYERLEELRLTMIIAYLGQLRRQLEELLRHRTLAADELVARLQQGMITSEYQFELAAISTLADRQKVLVEQIARAEQQRAAQERAYREAQRRRQILENLRSRQLDSYRLVQARHDQQRLDDLYALHARHLGDAE